LGRPVYTIIPGNFGAGNFEEIFRLHNWLLFPFRRALSSIFGAENRASFDAKSTKKLHTFDFQHKNHLEFAHFVSELHTKNMIIADFHKFSLFSLDHLITKQYFYETRKYS